MTGEGSEPLRVGIVGAGLIGAKRAAALRDGDVLVGVVDAIGARAADLADRCRARVFTTTAELADALGPGGIVIVATPHRELVPLSCAALDGGCHVLVEKPGARSAGELSGLADRAAATGATVRVGYNHRFHPAVRAAAGLIRTSGCGQVRLIRARYGHGGRLGYEREWRADPEVSGGGELLDQGSHLIDLVDFLAGPFRLRHAELHTLHWPMPVEDTALIVGGLANGGLVSLHASWMEWRNIFSLEVMLDRAKLDISGLGGSYGVETLTCSWMRPEYGPPDVEVRTFGGSDRSWADEWRDVAAAVSGASGTVGADLSSTARVLSLIDGARQYAQARAAG